MLYWNTARHIPIAIAINRAESSKGSLIGVLNLTIDSAPTSPRERVIEDFTIKTTTNVVTVIITIELVNWLSEKFWSPSA